MNDVSTELKKLFLWCFFSFFRQCVELWLERTPGLEESGFNFPAKYKAAVQTILQRETEMIEVIGF